MYLISCAGPDAEGKTKGCKYQINERGLNEEGKRVAKERAEAQFELIKEIQDDLERVEAVFYSHDVPWQFVGHEYVSGTCRDT